MASSIPKGQIPISCQLCEGGERIQCKCLDCDLLMCSKCKEKVHPKFKKAKDHKIVNIKDVGHIEGDSEDLDFSDICCQEHKKQYCCLFCEGCNQLVCPNCIAKSHNGHKFLDIKEWYEIKMERMKNRKKKLDSNMNDLYKVKMKLEQIKHAENSKYKKTREEILSQKAAFEREVKKALNRIDEEWSSTEQSIEEEYSKIKEMEKRCEETVKYMEDNVNQSDMEKFVEADPEYRSTLDVDISAIDFRMSPLPKFVPGVITQTTVGKFETCDKIAVNARPKIGFEVVKMMITNLSYVLNICTCSDGSLILGDGFSKITKVEIIENRVKVLSNYKINHYDIALNNFGDILISTLESRVKILSSKTGKLSDSLYQVPNFYIRSVHVTKDNKVIIGARSVKPPFPVTGRRVVIILDQNGQQEALFEFDRDNKPIFSYPIVINTVNGNVVVVDRIAEDSTGRIVTLGQDGKIINIYSGHPKVNKETPFGPGCLITTPSQCVIVIDVDTNTLHILDKKGQFIAYYNVFDHLGIDWPYSFSFSPSGNLYIGCTNVEESSSKVKAPLYEVEFSV